MEKTPAEVEHAIENIEVTNLQNAEIHETVNTERAKLLSFIKSKVPAADEAEDILQDVFFELIESKRLMQPIEKLASWLYTVARNKITDFYRKKKPLSLEEEYSFGSDDEPLMLADVLPAMENAPEDEMLKEAIFEMMEEALDEIPENQSAAFVMNEIEGKTLNEIAEETGVPLKTVISRKRYAVLYLRERLQTLYKELFNI
ncbi:MAG: sigma-70 family RNA polymerase sigma factor [Bacteroidetes bacterium]|nr:sigma-70 family RNA polymerase sigma factor [Bacteroidota bacterium]